MSDVLHWIVGGLGVVAGGLTYVFPTLAPVLTPIAAGLVGWALPQPQKLLGK